MKISFEYRITLAYLSIGIIWILFSDTILSSIIDDIDVLTQIQTYKGWFYVCITALIFFVFIKKHLNTLRNTELELETHKQHLQELVIEKTKELDDAIKKLRVTNEKLQSKNEIINTQNTDLKNTLQHLHSTQAQLLQAEKMASIGILTSGIAHEINNPLNYILGAVTGLEAYFSQEKKTPKNIELFIHSINVGIERITSIISGLNQFSSNKGSYNEACDIHEIITNCLTVINNQLTDRVTVSKDFTDSDVTIFGNSGQLHHALVNVLLNASQAIETKGTIHIATRVEKKQSIIQISDSGCGIEAHTISQITDPFYTTKEPGSGIGLGLTITYNIITAHKGTLQFESESGRGTTITITLPKK